MPDLLVSQTPGTRAFVTARAVLSSRFVRLRELFSCVPFRFRAVRAPGERSASTSPVSYGRAFIAIVLLSRIFSFSIGCGPADGSLGGKCTTHTYACSGNTVDDYCNGGAVCDPHTNTCVTAPPVAPPEPPTPHCESGDRGTCFANQISFACFADASPDAVECALNSSGNAGNASYCCTPPASSCLAQPSQCSTPSQYFDCVYAVSPAVVVGDPSLRCAFVPSYMNDDYCCASGDACFSVPADREDWCGSSTAYFCPGSTPPDAGNCERIDAPPGSNGLEAYCCDASGALDAGAD